jgi:sugar phosphate isomerase/epimerase
MRLGGPLFQKTQTPEEWTLALKTNGYRAAYCPVGPDADDDTVRAYEHAAKQADIVIAEVGAWSNPISADEATRKAALEKCVHALTLADRIGARCCVNITGSRSAIWDGPHPDNLTPDTFDLIVESTRVIIDAVKPRRSFYTLETMPWMYPDSADSYLKLLDAIDRPACAAHFDPVNLVCSPPRYYRNGDLIRECLEKLGPYVRSCHAKDIYLHSRLTVHLDETRPGRGGLDYRTFLRELSRLDPDIPLMMEHLPDEAEYIEAGKYIRSIVQEEGIAL